MKILLAALYSEQYPAAGETHALSVLAGQLRDERLHITDLTVLDLVALGRPMPDLVIQEAARIKPEIVGLSVGYGTFSMLRGLAVALRALDHPPKLIVYGGALASYLDERILGEIDPHGLVVVGEGEAALPLIVQSLQNGKIDDQIPNLVFLDAAGSIVRTKRELVDPSLMAPPDRRHLADHIPTGIQLYAESSRACSWSRCTFCLRRLLDLHGRGDEFHRLPFDRLASDLKDLRRLGASSFTFADEDFLGGNKDDLLHFIGFLEKQAPLHLEFDASATVQTVFSEGMSKAEFDCRQEALARLKKLGLRKIFLGIESGSASQLKRLAKGHSVVEAAAAIAALRSKDIAVEIGWILFDPLCTLKEVREDIQFLIDNDATDLTSYLFNELRLQTGTGYERLLRTHEKRTGRRLSGDRLDPDTLSYAYEYEEPRIAELALTTQHWASQLRPIHYPLKNLTRYSGSGELPTYMETPRNILRELRLGMCSALLETIAEVEQGDCSPKSDKIDRIVEKSAMAIVTWANDLPAGMQQLSLVSTLTKNAAAVTDIQSRRV